MVNNEWDNNLEMCQSCQGSGVYTIGDCEDGVDEECPECAGSGEVSSGDRFDPKRDAWTIND